MKMSFNVCKEKAKEISNEIYKKLHNSEDKFDKKFFIEYPDIENLKTKDIKFALVLGLNPSSSGENNNSNPNLFGYIPEKYRENSEQDILIRNDLISKRLVYQPYFKTFVNELIKIDYNPIWYNKTYTKNIIGNYQNLISNEQMEYIKHFNDYDRNHKYIIYSELIHYAETNSKKIIGLIEDQEICKLINTYLEALIDYLKPDFIISANATVSHYLIKHFNENLFCTDFMIEGRKVFLGSMLTGQRAMDIYSRERLFKDIKSYILNDLV